MYCGLLSSAALSVVNMAAPIPLHIQLTRLSAYRDAGKHKSRNYSAMETELLGKMDAYCQVG